MNFSHISSGSLYKCSNCKSQCYLDKQYQSCGKCRSVYYCSKECQKKDWPAHKPECNEDTLELSLLLNSVVRIYCTEGGDTKCLTNILKYFNQTNTDFMNKCFEITFSKDEANAFLSKIAVDIDKNENISICWKPSDEVYNITHKEDRENIKFKITIMSEISVSRYFVMVFDQYDKVKIKIRNKK